MRRRSVTTNKWWPRRPRSSPVAEVVVACALLALLGANVDWRQFSETWTAVRWVYIAIGLGTVVLIALLEATRIGVTFRAYRLGWVDSLRLYVIGSLFGSVLPGQLGSEVYKVMKLRHKVGGLIQPTALLIALRMCGLLALVAGATVSGIIYWNELNDDLVIQSPWPTLGGYWLAALAVIVVGVAVSKLSWAAYDRRQRGGQTMASSLAYAHTQTRVAFQALGWRPIGVILASSSIIVLVRTGTLLAIAESVEADVGFLGAMLVATMAALGTQLPISIAGLGVREGLIVILMTQLGVGYDQAFVAALVSRAFVAVVAFVGAMWALFEFFARRPEKLQPP